MPWRTRYMSVDTSRLREPVAPPILSPKLKARPEVEVFGLAPDEQLLAAWLLGFLAKLLFLWKRSVRLICFAE